jgi:hypothetical protein
VGVIVDENSNGGPGRKLASRRWFLRSLGLGAIATRLLSLVPGAAALPAFRSSAGQPAVPTGYLVPTYIPTGFEPTNVYQDRPDGFGGGIDEVTLWYRRPNAPLEWLYPLCIYIARSPRRMFAGTEGHAGEAVEFTDSSGRALRAQYHDGIWALDLRSKRHWATGNCHSMVVDVGGLRVGIRASPRGGVSKSELLAIAASLGPS